MVRLLIISAAFFFGAQAMAADCGVFKVVKGKVTYKKKGKDKFKKARKNKKVCQGYTVKTDNDGRAKIEMADKNEINISPDTEMVIEAYQSGKKAVLNVINGKVRSDVKNKYKDTKQSHYRVKTKSAVAGVRGTEFLTSYNRSTNQSRVVTFEGEVAVGQLKGDNFIPKVTVKPGQYTSNSPGTDPHSPKDVPPAEFAQMDQESKVDDAGSSNKQPASTNNQGKKQEKEKNEKGTNGQNGREPKGKGKGSGVKGPKGPKGTGAPGSGEGSDAGSDDSAMLDGDQKNSPELAGEPQEGDKNFRDDDQYGDPDFDPSAEDGSGDGRDPASVDGDGNPPPMFGDDRDPASVDSPEGNPTDLLPGPGDDLGPNGPGDLAGLPEEPRAPIVNNPIMDNIPVLDDSRINDTIINTNDVVNVIIQPCLPNQCN